MAAKKMNKVAEVRKAFVQSRVQATGKTGKEARAQFRQRFDKLATTAQGRATIQKATGLKGVKKELASAYKPKTSTTSTTTTTTTKNLRGVGVAAPTKRTEARTESAMRARGYSNRSARDATPYRPSRVATNRTVDGRDQNRNTTAGVGLIATAGAGAAALAVRGVSARGARLDAIQRQSLMRPAAEYEAMFGSRPSAMRPRGFSGNFGAGARSLFGRAGGGLRLSGR